MKMKFELDGNYDDLHYLIDLLDENEYNANVEIIERNDCDQCGGDDPYLSITLKRTKKVKT